MSENKIGIKSVSELLNMKFFIPDYQRGYRWTTQEVKDLLEDIHDFSTKECKSSGEFYCLQPLVVRQMSEQEKQEFGLSVNDVWYEVIDGQQRLTTLYLMLIALNSAIKTLPLPSNLYELRYQRDANRAASFLNSVATLSEADCTQIDYYHMSRAYFYIKEWFERRGIKLEDFCDVLLEYRISAKNLLKDIVNNVRFIWYESVDENPIKVFTRLNIGKIGLTNGELIKALMLNIHNFSNDAVLKLRQQEIASQWDNIEYTLQKEDFWLFLHDKGYTRPTRIDFLFDLVCEQNKLHLSDEEVKSIGSDEYKTFRYFNAYFKQDSASVDVCWSIVKDYFQTFIEWYDDLLLYHYVGFLISKEGGQTIERLLAKWNEVGNRQKLLQSLKQEIEKRLERGLELEKKGGGDGSQKWKYKPILLFHNIQTVINQNENELENNKYELGSFYKFPFHLYKKESWDVEHINSVTENDLDTPEAEAEWLVNIYNGVKEDIQEKIWSYLESDKEDKKKLFGEIKESFLIPKGWDSEEKNKLCNYTLLDASTNRSYGNAIFSAKRRIIISKDRGFSMPIPRLSQDKQHVVFKDDEKIVSAFVPPCTKNVFMKYYSSVVGDSNYWTKEDAEAYKNDIMNCVKKLEEEK
ncbi:DUF262 domain-containing protein [Segatella oulorum]|uniref:DUF262 domain-containing protein n=1 Tax=Segatella oulorum TaxID=28136 RepID=UPI0028E420AB|nr:DUF262 domain-containing protein [Segatella oulorum]